MIVNELPLLFSLMLAHLFADFFLQKKSWIDDRYKNKYKSLTLHSHVGIQTVLAIVVLALAQVDWSTTLIAALVIGVTHFMVDVAKSYAPPSSALWFVGDQLAHMIILIGVWLHVTEQWSLVIHSIDDSLLNTILILLIAYTLVIRPLQFMIAIAVYRWTPEVSGNASLASAGATIGKLERMIILTFVLLDSMVAVGFLLAAKSIFRFGDLRGEGDRKMTEYVMIGTLTSVLSTLAIGLAAKYLIEHVA